MRASRDALQPSSSLCAHAAFPSEELFNLINTLPTCYEVVSGKARPNAAAQPKRKGNAATGRPPKHAKHVSGVGLIQALTLRVASGQQAVARLLPRGSAWCCATLRAGAFAYAAGAVTTGQRGSGATKCAGSSAERMSAGTWWPLRLAGPLACTHSVFALTTDVVSLPHIPPPRPAHHLERTLALLGRR